MKVLEKICNFVGKFMSLIVFAIGCLALFLPKTCIWVDTNWINYLLMIVMFGMGLTLKFEDFKVVFVKPKEIIIGAVTQFTMMPLIAFALGKIFNLEIGLLAGIILVGTCPGGTASNVMTYLSKGDVALSVGMTSVNTLLAPILTPAITYLLLKTNVDVDVVGMFLSILKVVIIPIALGLILNKFFGKITEKLTKVLPLVSVVAIALIVASVVSHNSEKILSTGAIVFVVVILQNLLGYASGYGVAKLFKMDLAKKKTLSIEIGMQNSGLSTSLATSAFPNLAMATVPGAIFSVWHNFSGAILANIFRSIEEKNNK